MKYDFDSILARLRSGVQGTVSTLEGTFAGDLLQSVAAELARIWSQEVDTAAQRGFLATAEGQWLDAVCGDYGITRKSGESDEGLRARALEQVPGLKRLLCATRSITRPHASGHITLVWFRMLPK